MAEEKMMGPASRKMVKAESKDSVWECSAWAGCREDDAGRSLQRTVVSTGLPSSLSVVFIYLKPTELLSLHSKAKKPH